MGGPTVKQDVDLAGMRLGNYRLHRVLGRGRMGVVYLAEDEALLRPTAVKVLSWAFLENRGNRPESWFLAEARSVARINHPAVVQVYSAAKHGAHYYIAMEYVEGESGEALVARKGPLPPGDATQVVLQIAGALDLAHASNIIHRDVKPANILVKPDGTAKLGDFGMSLHASSVEPSVRLPMGTPRYMAPEIWTGSLATPLTDLYALGATYFHLLTGKPPFDGPDLPSIIDLHQHGEIPSPAIPDPAVAAGCARIIRKCMAKEPSQRYRSVQEFGWDLRGILRTLNTHSPEAAAPVSVVPEPSGGNAIAEHTIEPWVAALGFACKPFTPAHSFHPPYRGEPFGGLVERLKEFVKGETGKVLVLTGDPGSGRTWLARQALAGAHGENSVAYINVSHGEHAGQKPCGLSLRACRALGALPSPTTGRDPALDGLVDHLAKSPSPPTLVLDDLPGGEQCLSEVDGLVQVTRSTRYLRLLLVLDRDFAEQLLVSRPATGTPAIEVANVPALTPEQTRRYVSAWLESARLPLAPPMLVTPDAALLVHHRGGGNLAKTNFLAGNMLRMASIEKRRVLSSWYAWLSPSDGEWVMEAGAISPPPPNWPTPELLEILNFHRERLGIAQRLPGEIVE